MQVELNKDDLGKIISWYHDAATVLRMSKAEGDLYGRLLAIHREAEELEGLDLSDCGDACKL